jgi:hypothetical protein
MSSRIARATVAPAISATLPRPTSMSEATPPAVMTLPSLTTRVFVVRSADRGRQFGKGSGPPIELIGQHHRRSQDQIFSVSLRCYLAT